jgi:hypothetical protein
MKNADFSRATARSLGATGFLLGLAFLATLLNTSLSAQDSPAASTHTVVLDYQETQHLAVGWGVVLTPEAKPFQKEPDLAQRKVWRGTLQFGGGDQAVRFVWDYTQGKLHLDVNNNRDLTDDPVFSCPASRFSDANNQTFTNVHLSFKTPAGNRQALIDLSLFYPRSPRPNASATCRSLWEGKVSLQGKDWQVGVVETAPGGGAEAGLFVIRPWEDRDVALENEAGSIDLLPFSPNLYFCDRAYRVDCSPVDQEGGRKFKVSLREKEAELGELKLTGKHIQRLRLTADERRNPSGKQPGTSETRAPFTVVLDHPGPIAKVPVGSYNRCEVQLQAGKLMAYRDVRRYDPASNLRLTVSTTNTAELAAGGPLTNSVSLGRRGRYLSMGYQLLGADGAVYQLASGQRLLPPSFKIQKNGKVLHADNFQYG